jgi:hypothetical protein
MNKRQKNEGQMLVRVQTFVTDKAPAFTNTPPKPGDAKYQATLPLLADAIAKLGGKAAIQAGGGYGEETQDQRVLRSEVEETLRSINRDAATIATEKGQPGLMDRFRMPYGSGDTELRAKLLGFADAIEELGLAADFVDLGQEETPASLRQMAADFEGSEGDQGGALGEQAGATAVIPAVLREGRGHVKVFHSLISNRFKDDPETLGAWKTVSRVQRDGGGSNGDAPPSPPPA